MGKIIIDNRSDLSDSDAIQLVIDVIREGRICNDGKQYCYLTGYRCTRGNYQVSTDLNKKSDRFVIIKERQTLSSK